MDVVLLIGRILFASPFLGSGVAHLTQSRKETDAETKQMEMIQFNKDVGLAGAALIVLWVFSEDPGLTLTGPLFS